MVDCCVAAKLMEKEVATNGSSLAHTILRCGEVNGKKMGECGATKPLERGEGQRKAATERATEDFI